MVPEFQPFDNFMDSNQPFVKVTAQLSSKHEAVGFYQNDRSKYSSNRELDNKSYLFNSTGGGLMHARVNSVWSNSLTTSLAYNYNNKRGNDADTYKGVNLSGPQIQIHQDAFLNSGWEVAAWKACADSQRAMLTKRTVAPTRSRLQTGT